MTAHYSDGASFRQALEARLKRAAEERGTPLNTLRQKVVMERLLARLFSKEGAPWRLKGGYAMELRLAGRARTTRDLDLAAFGTSPTEAHGDLLHALREAAALDVGDFLVFTVAGPGESLAAQQAGGFRFGVTARLGGRKYAGFHVDIGLDASLSDRSELLVCEDHLQFAGIPPARVLVIPRERQFAEKIHAYTRPWGDRTNTRTKDLVDLLLLIDLGLEDRAHLHGALHHVFDRRGGHEQPQQLPRPPAEWADEYVRLAEQVGLTDRSLDGGFERLEAYWKEHHLGDGPEP